MSSQKNIRTTNRNHCDSLPPIPDKLYFTIGEVAKLCQLRPHVLRYWEQEFNNLSPTKRRGNRRYYQLKDVLMVRKIRQLLYEEGYTIEGARQKLMEASKATKSEHQIYQSMHHAVTELEKLLAVLESD